MDPERLVKPRIRAKADSGPSAANQKRRRTAQHSARRYGKLRMRFLAQGAIRQQHHAGRNRRQRQPDFGHYSCPYRTDRNTTRDPWWTKRKRPRGSTRRFRYTAARFGRGVSRDRRRPGLLTKAVLRAGRWPDHMKSGTNTLHGSLTNTTATPFLPPTISLNNQAGVKPRSPLVRNQFGVSARRPNHRKNRLSPVRQLGTPHRCSGSTPPATANVPSATLRAGELLAQVTPDGSSTFVQALAPCSGAGDRPAGNRRQHWPRCRTFLKHIRWATIRHSRSTAT